MPSLTHYTSYFIQVKTSHQKGQTDSTVGEVFALHAANLDTTYRSPSTSGLFPECRARSKPLALPGVVQPLQQDPPQKNKQTGHLWNYRTVEKNGSLLTA